MEFKFLQATFGESSKAKGHNAIEHVTSGSLAAVSGAATSVFSQNTGGWDIDRAVSEGLERVIWIFRCVDVIATNFAGLPLNGRKGDPFEGEKFDLDEEIYKLLNRRPNTYETAQQFKYRLASQVLLSKRGAFIEIEKSNGGTIIGLHILPAHMVEPIPSTTRYVTGFRLKKAGGAGEDPVPPESIIWVRTRPHPLDPYAQITPLAAAGIVAETDFLARLFNRNFLMNDGRPTTLVTVNGELDDQEAEEIKLRFSGGPMYAGRTTVIEAEGVTVADLSSSPRDVQWIEAIKGSKEDILLAFGVAESVMGNASGRTFDNADAEREGFWKDTMVPLAGGIARCLDPLTGDINDDNYISPYYDGIDVLKRQERARHAKLLEEWQEGVISLNEYLNQTGRKKLVGVPGADMRFMQNGLVLTEPENYELFKAIPMVAPPVPAQPGMEDPNALGAKPGDPTGQGDFESALAARMQQFIGGGGQPELPAAKAPAADTIDGEVVEPQGKANPRAAHRDALEEQVDTLLNTWSSEQEVVLVGRLGHAKALMHTRHWVGKFEEKDRRKGDKPLDTNYVVQAERWKSNLQRDLGTVLANVVTREMKRATSEMDSSGFAQLMFKHGLTARKTGAPASKVFGSGVVAKQAQEAILASLMDIATKAADRQSKRVADRIKELDSQGKSIKQIQAEVKRMIGERSAWRKGLATHLSTSAIEASAHAAWSKAGPLVEKVWNTAGDESVRATHRKVDGTTVPVGKSFRVGAYQLDHPCDTKAGPEETANCRCYCDFIVAPKYEAEYDSV